MTRVSSGTSLSTIATKTRRCRGVSSSFTPAAARPADPATPPPGGSNPNRSGSRSQSSVASGTVGFRQVPPDLGRHVEEHELVRPGREQALATELADLAGDSNQRVRSSLIGQVIEPGPAIRSCGPRRRTSPSAIRTNISCSRTSATSRRDPVPVSIWTHSADSGSSTAAAPGPLVPRESAGDMLRRLLGCSLRCHAAQTASVTYPDPDGVSVLLEGVGGRPDALPGHVQVGRQRALHAGGVKGSPQ